MEPRAGEPATLIELEPPVHNRRHHPESRLAGQGMGWVRGAAAPLSLGRRPGATRASGGADCEVGLKVVRSLTFTAAQAPPACRLLRRRLAHAGLTCASGFPKGFAVRAGADVHARRQAPRPSRTVGPGGWLEAS